MELDVETNACDDVQANSPFEQWVAVIVVDGQFIVVVVVVGWPDEMQDAR